VDIIHYLTETGKDPFQSWIDRLPDVKARVASFDESTVWPAAIRATRGSCAMEFTSFGSMSGQDTECILQWHPGP